MIGRIYIWILHAVWAHSVTYHHFKCGIIYYARNYILRIFWGQGSDWSLRQERVTCYQGMTSQHEHNLLINDRPLHHSTFTCVIQELKDKYVTTDWFIPLECQWSKVRMSAIGNSRHKSMGNRGIKQSNVRVTLTSTTKGVGNHEPWVVTWVLKVNQNPLL